MLTVALLVVVCVVLLVLAFAFPLASRGTQRRVGRAASKGARTGRRAPGPLGRAFSKPFSVAGKMTDRSGAAGRAARRKLPF